MTTAKWTINTGEQQDLGHYPRARFTEKGCLPVWGGDALRATPQVLSMPPCTVKSDEEKSKHAGLAQENGFVHA
jgi:hypothetical protein